VRQSKYTGRLGLFRAQAEKREARLKIIFIKSLQLRFWIIDIMKKDIRESGERL
jgi:hypothetical protein